MARENVFSSGDIEDMCSDDDFEDLAIAKSYLNPKGMYAKTPNSQKNSSSQSTSSELVKKYPKKLEHLTYQDLRISPEDNSKYVINHPLKFNAPIFQKPGFDKRSLREQVKVLCSYHTKLSRNIANQAKLQIQCVPLPKLIKVSPKWVTPKCSTSLVCKVNGNDSEDERENNNIDPFDELTECQSYVSRSGRITKRKFYNEPPTNLELKKLKVQDGEWHSITRTSGNSKCAGRGKKPTSDGDGKVSDNKNISSKNLDIISKSKLFKDKDTIKPNRMAKIAEGVELKRIKDKEEEIKQEMFEKSLLNENVEELDVAVTDVEDIAVKRRVTPPPPKLKASRAKKQKEYSELEIATKKGKSITPSKTQVEWPSNGQTQNQKKTSDNIRDETVSSTSNSIRRSKKKMVQCPICSRDFEEANIQAHASSCGENTIETRSHPTGHSNMTCQYCDRVFMFDNEYENHIKTCSSQSSFH